MKPDIRIEPTKGLCRDSCCAGEIVAGPSCGDSGTSVPTAPPLKMWSPELEQSASGQEGLQKTIFRITGMDCGDCAAKLEKKITALPGVRSATLNFGSGKMTVEHTLIDSAIIHAVKQAGYRADKIDKIFRQPLVKPVWWQNVRTLATISSGILLAIATGFDWLGMPERIVILLYALTAILGGFHAAKSGLYSLRFLSLDMNFLMTTAIVGAAAIGEWGEGATVAFLFSFGNTLQTYTMDKTRRSIQTLMELAPPEALVRRGQQEKRLPIEDIVVGDIIIVKPGERIAMDEYLSQKSY